MDSNTSAQKPPKEKFQWADEGVSTLIRVIILGWSGAILTLNYVSIPGIPQKQIDPTFIASVFTTTLATFGVQTGKKKDESDSNNTNKGDCNHAKSN
jgi:hypothetical protein